MINKNKLPLLPPISNPDDRVDLDATDSIIGDTAPIPTVSGS